MKPDAKIEAIKTGKPTTFIDDIWPVNKYANLKPGELYDPRKDMNSEPFGWTGVRIWRMQTLLEKNPLGIPLSLFPEKFEQMFKRKFLTQEYGYEVLIDMITDKPELFTIHEPDYLTEILFPELPDDVIIFDASLDLTFPSWKTFEGLPLGHPSKFSQEDWDMINSIAWFNRDEDFPEDVVRAGDNFQVQEDFGLLNCGKLDALPSLGVYQAAIISVASPSLFYINMKGPNYDRICNLANEVNQYIIDQNKLPDFYILPEEYLYPGYPCLLNDPERAWERCRIVERKQNSKVLVEAVDHGGFMKVRRQDLYMMPKKFLEIPPQAVPVSMAGIKPVAEKWSKKAGARLRCFSYPKYFMEFLLLPLEKSIEVNKKSSKYKIEPSYEALICDRNGTPNFQIFVDNVLITEFHAVQDEDRIEFIEKYRKEFREVCKKLDEPVNPMAGRFLKWLRKPTKEEKEQEGKETQQS